jgi:RIO-like serine/threonine protein kinase
MSNENIKKIRTLDRTTHSSYEWVDKRAFWILFYCFFVSDKNEFVQWKELANAKLMGTETLARHLSKLVTDRYLTKMETGRCTFYKLKAKAKQLIEQQVREAEILLELRNIHSN